MKEYKIDEIVKDVLMRLYARKGKRLSSISFAKLKKWYDNFLHEDPECFDWQWSVLSEINNEFDAACHYDVLSSDFRKGISYALALCTSYVERFADTEDDDVYISTFIERVVYMYGMIVGFILTRNLELIEERLKISIDDFNDIFCMDVYGAFPTSFLGDGILLVGIVRKGVAQIGENVSFPFLFDTRDYGSYNAAIVNSAGKIKEIAMFGRKYTRVRAGDVCVMSVKYSGMIVNDDDFPYPFHIYQSDPAPDMRMASVEVREIEYADEYMSCHCWDNNIIELSEADRRFMETVRTTLCISEARAKEIEEECIPQLLSASYVECFEAVRECLNGIDNLISTND